MTKSFALLTIAAFALSAPINARSLVATGETDQSAAAAGAPAEIAPPECTKEATEPSVTAEATGGMPDTEATAAVATTTACCWYYWFGNWYCGYC